MKSFCCLFFFLSLVPTLFSQSAPFTDEEVQTIRGFFESNIGISDCYTGFVVAAPIKTNPNYYYHWQRDAAISMNVLFTTANSSADFDERFQNYVTWVLNAQSESDPNGINVLGEPKFFCDGTVYNQGWCRPQNDGPALRSIALINYANWLIENNREAYVKQYLYNYNSDNNYSCNSDDRTDCGYVGINETQCEDKGCCWNPVNPNPDNLPWCFFKTNGNNNGIVPTNLDYVTTVWQDTNNCDLWEEVRGIHWFTLMVQHKALIMGSQLASYFGDTTRANNYMKVAMSMNETIKSFDNNGDIEDDQREHDCSILVGTLYGGTPGLYPPTDNDILNTLSIIREYFNSTMNINQLDNANGIPGTLIGRYADDSYPGCNGNGGSKGHAWILCSNSVADIYYHNSLNLINNKDVLNNDNINIYLRHLSYDYPKLSQYIKNIIKNNNNNYDTLSDNDKLHINQLVSNGLFSSGDGQLTRIKYHVSPCDLHMSEQICETNGLEIGATDLTWSYGAFLAAWNTREQALESGAKFIEYENFNKTNYNLMMNTVNADCGGCNSQCDD